MEQAILDQLINGLASVFGVEDATLVAVLVLLAALANLVSRLIPDDSTGWLAVVRKVAAVLGLYVPNRISRNTTSRDAEKVALEAAEYLPILRGVMEEQRERSLAAQPQRAPIVEPKPLVIPPEVLMFLQAQSPQQDAVEDDSDAR